MMSGGDDDGVDCRIADQAVIIAGTVVKSAPLRGVMGVGAIGGTDADQRHTSNSFYRPQQCTGCALTSSDQSDSNPIRGCNSGCSSLPRDFYGYASGFLG